MWKFHLFYVYEFRETMSQFDNYLIFQDTFLCMLFTKCTLSSNMYIPFDNRTSQLCSTFTSQNGDRTSGSDESKSLKTWIILAVLWTKLAKGLLRGWAKYISDSVAGTPWVARVTDLCQWVFCVELLPLISPSFGVKPQATLLSLPVGLLLTLVFCFCGTWIFAFA